MGIRVPATVVDDVDDHRGVPGAIELRTWDGAARVAGIGFICPCGCGQEGWLPVESEASPSWTWDGDRERPTLSPSVLQRNGCKWHGWLRAGVWEGC